MRELLLGLSMGFGAGIAPGPLLTLVLVSTVRSGFRSGLKVAASPLLTDGPIIAVVLLLISTLPHAAETGLSVAGGLFVLYLGIETARSASGANLARGGTAPRERDLLKGVLVNIVSPHPWLFWIGVGGPILSNAWRSGPAQATAFVAGFYLLLIGSKVALAATVALGRGRLTDGVYRRLLLGAGVLLAVDGLFLVGTSVL